MGKWTGEYVGRPGRIVSIGGGPYRSWYQDYASYRSWYCIRLCATLDKRVAHTRQYTQYAHTYHYTPHPSHTHTQLPPLTYRRARVDTYAVVVVAGGLRVRGARITRRLPRICLEPHIPTRVRYSASVAQVTRGLPRRRLHPPRDTILARALHQHRDIGVFPRSTGCAVVANVVLERKITCGTESAPGRLRIPFLPRIAHGTLDVRVRPVRGVGGAREHGI